MSEQNYERLVDETARPDGEVVEPSTFETFDVTEEPQPIVDPKTVSIAALATEPYTPSFVPDFIFVSTLDGDPVHVGLGQSVDSEKYWPLRGGGFVRISTTGSVSVYNAHSTNAAIVTFTAVKNAFTFHHKARG